LRPIARRRASSGTPPKRNLRLIDEHGADVAEVTVGQHGRQRKRELGWPVGEMFVPQVHPGVAEVDWRKALVELAGAGRGALLAGIGSPALPCALARTPAVPLAA
jgi:hypothetical protein